MVIEYINNTFFGGVNLKWYKKIFFRTIKTDLTYEEAMQIMKTGQAILIDVRSEDEYKRKHINGAINVPVYNIESINSEITNKDEVILLYCKTGQRSNIAKEILMQNGYKNVYTVQV